MKKKRVRVTKCQSLEARIKGFEQLPADILADYPDFPFNDKKTREE